MRKRRPRVVWLPNARENRYGANGTSVDPADNSAFELSLDYGTDGLNVTGIIGVVSDQPASLAFAGSLTSLSDLQSSGYRLRRLVGKIFVGIDQVAGTVATPQATDILVTAGFIVLRTTQLGAPLSNLGDYAVNALAGVGDPWIWRRSWYLGNNAAKFAQQPAAITAFLPESNTILGSALDGPHLDQKTARVIGPEERLFFVASAQAQNPGGQENLTNRCRIVGDVRVLASMRTSSGNRRNASR